MNFGRFFLLTLLLVPATVFGQTAQEKYREAKAAEFRSDNATDHNKREAHISQAFGAIVEAVVADVRYVNAFATITRKYVARLSSHTDFYWYITDGIVKAGEKRSGNPVFKSLVVDVIRGYKQMLLQKGFAPGKPIFQSRQDRFHCNVLTLAEQIYKLSRLASPGSAETIGWGRYAADAYMTNFRGCGGEGSDIERDPFKAYSLYSLVQYRPGMYRTGKMIGDLWMEKYIFGGSDFEGNGSYDPGHRPYFDMAMQFYRGGGVARNGIGIRSTVLRNLRRAEEYEYQRAIDVAQKTLAELF